MHTCCSLKFINITTENLVPNLQNTLETAFKVHFVDIYNIQDLFKKRLNSSYKTFIAHFTAF